MAVKPLQEGEWVPETMQVSIVKRFLQGAEYEAFMQNYKQAKKSSGIGGKDRKVFLNEPVTEVEKEYARFFLDENDERTIKTAATAFGIKADQLSYKAKNAIVKLAYKNKAALGL